MSDLETVWSGSTWRSFPEPSIAVPPVYRDPQPRSRKDNSRAQVLDVLGSSWMSVQGVMDRVGISERSTRHWLTQLVQEGSVEMLWAGATKQGGQSQKLYRRRLV